jgi:hypothetical protein
MKILLDECLPRKIKNSLAMHECRTVPEVGLAGKRNGELLSLAEEDGYEIFLTMGLSKLQMHLGATHRFAPLANGACLRVKRFSGARQNYFPLYSTNKSGNSDFNARTLGKSQICI